MTKKKLLLSKNHKGVLKAVGGIDTARFPGETDIQFELRMGAQQVKQYSSDFSAFTKDLKSRPIKMPGTTGGFGNAHLGVSAVSESKTVTTDVAKDLASSSTENGGKDSSGNGAAAIAAGAELTNMVGQTILDKTKKETTNEFGLTDPDEKNMKASSTLSGVTKGAALGASVGSFFPGAGTVIGAGIGALAGGIAGFIKGKNAGKKAQEEYDRKTKGATDARTRSQDMAESAALYARRGTKLSKKVTVFKSGGKLETPGAVNIIPKGKLHREHNNLGNKDKGIPIVSAADGTKEYEIEKEELLLRLKATRTVEDMVYKFNSTRNEDILEDLGKYMTEELSRNTHDYSGKFKVKLVE